MYLSRICLKPDLQTKTQLAAIIEKDHYNEHQLIWDLFDAEKRHFLYRKEHVVPKLRNHPAIKHESVYYILSKQPPKSQSPLFDCETKSFKPVINEGDTLSFKLRVNPVVTKKINGKSKRNDVVMDEQIVFMQGICEEFNLGSSNKKTLLKKTILNHFSTAIQQKLIAEIKQSRYGMQPLISSPVSLLNLSTQARIEQRLMNWLCHNPSRKSILACCQHQVVTSEGNQLVIPDFQFDGYTQHLIPRKKREIKYSTVDLSGVIKINQVDAFKQLMFDGIGASKGFGCGLMMIRRYRN